MGRNAARAVAAVDARVLDVLHNAADHALALGIVAAPEVGHGIDVDFDRVEKELVEQDRGRP